MAGGAVRATNYLRELKAQVAGIRLPHQQEQFLETASIAVKFLLPDPSVAGLLDPDLRALDGLSLRLPFEAVLIETQFPVGDAGRGIILATEHKGAIRVTGCGSPRGMKGWTSPAGVIEIDPADWKPDNGAPGVKYRLVSGSYPGQLASYVIDLLVALSCCNVQTQALPIDPKLAKAASKRGALPFDTYHVLTIKPSNPKGPAVRAHDHRSPREHLRRGHVRRLEDGRRLWVNATVVNPGACGTVFKSYAVK